MNSDNTTSNANSAQNDAGAPGGQIAVLNAKTTQKNTEVSGGQKANFIPLPSSYEADNGMIQAIDSTAKNTQSSVKEKKKTADTNVAKSKNPKNKKSAPIVRFSLLHLQPGANCFQVNDSDGTDTSPAKAPRQNKKKNVEEDKTEKLQEILKKRPAAEAGDSAPAVQVPAKPEWDLGFGDALLFPATTRQKHLVNFRDLDWENVQLLAEDVLLKGAHVYDNFLVIGVDSKYLITPLLATNERKPHPVELIPDAPAGALHIIAGFHRCNVSMYLALNKKKHIDRLIAALEEQEADLTPDEREEQEKFIRDEYDRWSEMYKITSRWRAHFVELDKIPDLEALRLASNDAPTGKVADDWEKMCTVALRLHAAGYTSLPRGSKQAQALIKRYVDNNGATAPVKSVYSAYNLCTYFLRHMQYAGLRYCINVSRVYADWRVSYDYFITGLLNHSLDLMDQTVMAAGAQGRAVPGFWTIPEIEEADRQFDLALRVHWLYTGPDNEKGKTKLMSGAFSNDQVEHFSELDLSNPESRFARLTTHFWREMASHYESRARELAEESQSRADSYRKMARHIQAQLNANKLVVPMLTPTYLRFLESILGSFKDGLL
ncbi:hypothetical protein SISSUDRAFT_1092913 [Sistotremastrum suecicum HHB10207 ss-3]|uniref:Uncharacterized protein n=1 Tax=Sistotremastrum suecicum HHB10207 ss-3 TaxID=1314776 RepID=A0A165XWB7_9AGAM|nr:hypothetical protein SISSUDRAFT_1092913 [Sistotremastrum suecicum HHB10207 ss-3]